MKPRLYQSEAVNAAWQSIRNGHSPLIVLPTGAGKSIVIAEICRQAIAWGGRAIVLAHRKELLTQNCDKMQRILPEASVGIYSAGLNSRDTDADVIFAGIQSIYSRAFELNERHVIIIDEAHLVPYSSSTMYRTFLNDMAVSNPQARVIGLTATPFRMSTGLLTDGDDSIFDEICYELPVSKLMADGNLCKVTNRKADIEVNEGSLVIRGGEYTDHSQQMAFESISEAAVKSFVDIANETDRKSVLVFCSGVDHATHVRDLIEEITGEDADLVTGETDPLFRAESLRKFANRESRWLVNVNVLTEGFDSPCIDCICVLRSTMSPGLFAQIVGRGLRTYPGKTECLVVDYGGNIKRHGAIDDPHYGRSARKKGGQKGATEAPSKACVECREPMHARATECPWCGEEQPASDVPHDAVADQESAILAEESKPRTLAVESVQVWEHSPYDPSKLKTLRVQYHCGDDLRAEQVSEWVCFNHDESNYARKKADEWWSARSLQPAPKNVVEAVELIKAGCVVHPYTITVKQDGKWQRIINAEWVHPKPVLSEDDIETALIAAEAKAVEFENDFGYDDEDLPF